MSKYTTELRFICETLAEYDASQGYEKVSDIIDASWDKIFDFDFPIFDNSYKSVLCKKIIMHYYTREIGMETYGLWKLKLETLMNEIMPYYNERYKSAELKYNPLYDTDYTRTTNGGETGENSKSSNGSTNRIRNDKKSYENSSNDNSANNVVDKYSDTPQGGLVGLKNDNYLTSARLTEGQNSTIGERSGNEDSEASESGINSNSESGEYSNTREYLEHVVGKMNGGSYAKAIEDYRNAIINVDMEVIDNLKELFIMLW